MEGSGGWLFHPKLTEAERVEGDPENQRPTGKLSGASREPAGWRTADRSWKHSWQMDQKDVSALNMSGFKSQNWVPTVPVKCAPSSPSHSPLSNMGQKRWQSTVRKQGQALAAYPAFPTTDGKAGSGLKVGKGQSPSPNSVTRFCCYTGPDTSSTQKWGEKPQDLSDIPSRGRGRTSPRE